MIQASVIHNNILARLDAEGTDRYTFNEDTKYAINGAIDEIVTICNAAFAEKKLSPENLRELLKTKIWQANSYSRVSFDESTVGHGMWSIVAVYPKPVVNKKSLVPTSSTGNVSKFRPDVTFIGGAKPAKRLSHEQWTDGEDNAFMPGNNVLEGGLAEYAYLDAADYTSSTYPGNTDKIEITIRPDVSNEFVAIAYIKQPDYVTSTSSNIEFPKSLTELITDIALNKIAIKQGDATNLYGVTAQAINRLVNLIK